MGFEDFGDLEIWDFEYALTDDNIYGVMVQPPSIFVKNSFTLQYIHVYTVRNVPVYKRIIRRLAESLILSTRPKWKVSLSPISRYVRD